MPSTSMTTGTSPTRLTVNLGLRYELQGTWSERQDRLTYLESHLRPTPQSQVAEARLVSLQRRCVLRKDRAQRHPQQFALEQEGIFAAVGFAYSWDQKTVIRGGYGIFWIPNYASFALNPDNDVVGLATTTIHRHHQRRPHALRHTGRNELHPSRGD